ADTNTNLRSRVDPAPRPGVDGPCDEILSHPAFATDQDRRVGVRYFHDRSRDRAHLRALAEERALEAQRFLPRGGSQPVGMAAILFRVDLVHRKFLEALTPFAYRENP